MNTNTHRQQGDIISLLLFFQDKERVLIAGEDTQIVSHATAWKYTWALNRFERKKTGREEMRLWDVSGECSYRPRAQ
jgi:hypothetical protein